MAVIPQTFPASGIVLLFSDAVYFYQIAQSWVTQAYWQEFQPAFVTQPSKVVFYFNNTKSSTGQDLFLTNLNHS